jgi:hypothetical protein
MIHQVKKLLTATALLASLVSVAQAQWYLAGDFQGWNASSTPMTAGPNANEYSYTITGGTAGTLGNCKVTDGTFNNTWPSANLTFLYDTTGSATIHFWPGTATDGWVPYANRVGYDDPNNDVGWGVAGTFDGWDGTQALLAPIGNGVYSNNIVVTNAATTDNEFKFQSPAGSFSFIYFGSDFGNGGNNGVFTTTNSPQTLPVVLDLPNGRWLIGAPAIPPVNYITFQLDMTYEVAAGNFTNNFVDPSNPSNTNSVAIAGDFIGWGTTAQLTNNPSLPDVRSNIYSGTFPYQAFLPTKINVKFRVNNLDGGYESPASTAGANRQIAFTSANQVVPVILYDDLGVGDLINQATLVTFSLYCPDQTAGAGGVVFTKGSDTIWVSGSFLNWPAWGVNALPANQQMFESATADVYTNSLVVPRGSSVAVTYKYSFDGLDNENGSNTNHIRYIRTYAANYAFPQDAWSWSVCPPGTAYPNPGITRTNIVEPSFGYLVIQPASSGTLPISWLGRPGVVLQSRSDLTSGIWSTNTATDGTQSINWPNGGNQFFRLLKYSTY